MRPVPSHSDDPPPPVHVAIIMDGNGRWAKARGLPRTAGHKKGAEAVKTVVRAAADFGVSYLTLFSFSSENWKRPVAEVRDLMGLLRLYLRNEVAYLQENGVRLQVIGDRARLEPDIVALIEDAERLTAGNRRLTLVMALSYGGRADIAAAARRIAREVAAGTLDPEGVDEDCVARRLSTAGIPEPDILIRTSGEQRISNFLLWEMAYTEFVFVDTLWPDFGRDDLARAIKEFQGRERRYGATGV